MKPPDNAGRGPKTPPLTTLERIGGYLRRQGLTPPVQVSFDAVAGDYILEDDDGLIHAANYDRAVAIIERTWPAPELPPATDTPSMG